MKLLVALLCAMLAAPAAAFKAKIPNKAGDYINLTDEKCRRNGKTLDNLRFVFARSPTGSTSTGCWGIVAETIFVVWDGGKVSTFPFEAVEEVEE